ncbi:MAG: hypothetical protein HOQ43_10775 [Glycomyces artemisiae]|uniref:Uncharacterized protein n=1 Tax=Glycomyces artemisiae TaxID=1076443 RepID=A0A850CA29_9ACTN|nr:hypothetical protein [Glycomyces artemisiae]
MPVESEPCAEHAPRTSVTWTDVHEAVMTATVVPIIVDMQTGGARGFTDAEQAALARAVADQLVPGGAS